MGKFKGAKRHLLVAAAKIVTAAKIDYGLLDKFRDIMTFLLN